MSPARPLQSLVINAVPRAFGYVFGGSMAMVLLGHIADPTKDWASPCDIAAATLIATECGAIATRLGGTPLDVRYRGSILLGTPNVHASLVVRLMFAVQ